MSTTGLVRLGADAAYARALNACGLLREAIAILRDRGVELDLEGAQAAILSRVQTIRGVRSDGEAKAVVVVAINLALSHLGLTSERAADVLAIKPMEKVYLLGEKLCMTDPAERLRKVLQQDGMRIKTRTGHRGYRVLEAHVRERLERWTQVGLLTSAGLPPADKEEYGECMAILQTAERDVVWARHVNWSAVLNDPGVAFAADAFATKAATEATASVWTALLRSLVVNAVSEEREREAKTTREADQQAWARWVIATPDRLQAFVDTMAFSSEDLQDKAIALATRLSRLFFATGRGPSLVSRPIRDAEDMTLLLGRIQALVGEMSADVRRFYMGVEDVMSPRSEELEVFWASRVLLSTRLSHLPPALRSGAVWEPWTGVTLCRDFAELHATIRGLANWPVGRVDGLFHPVDELWSAFFLQQVEHSTLHGGRKTRAQIAQEWLEVLQVLQSHTAVLNRFARDMPWYRLSLEQVMALVVQADESDWVGVEPVLTAYLSQTRGRGAGHMPAFVGGVLASNVAVQSLQVWTQGWRRAEWEDALKSVFHTPRALHTLHQALPPELRGLLMLVGSKDSFCAFARMLSVSERRELLALSIGWAGRNAMDRRLVVSLWNGDGHTVGVIQRIADPVEANALLQQMRDHDLIF